MQQLWIATGNQGKLNEFKMLFNKAHFELHSQGELPVFSAPPENGDSFLANARIKSRSLKSVKTGVWVLGEDSGLQVEGIGGLPGIHSARYAGPKAADAENVAKLLKMMQIRQVTNRQAQFISQLVVYRPNGEEILVDGVLKGEIAKNARGTTGFGYDSVFIPEGESKTLAELGLAVKNRISHRAMAVQKLIQTIEPELVC